MKIKPVTDIKITTYKCEYCHSKTQPTRLEVKNRAWYGDDSIYCQGCVAHIRQIDSAMWLKTYDHLEDLEI